MHKQSLIEQQISYELLICPFYCINIFAEQRALLPMMVDITKAQPEVDKFCCDATNILQQTSDIKPLNEFTDLWLLFTY